MPLGRLTLPVEVKLQTLDLVSILTSAPFSKSRVPETKVPVLILSVILSSASTARLILVPLLLTT